MSGTSEQARSGVAREVPKGRLASFEDDSTPTFTLPPRPGHARTGSTLSGDDQQPPGDEPLTSAGEGGEPEPGSASGLQDAAQAGAAVAGPPPTEDVAQPSGPSGPVRASNVHIPVELLDAFTEAKATHNLSNGELIITAIEASYDELRRQLRPPSATGGSLFAQRVSRAPRTPTGPVTPVNYRLRADDYATLDRLVRDLGASSRSHLISAALRNYLGRTD